DAHADGAPARVLQAARRLARGAQQKRVRPGQTRMQHAELPGLEPCEAADRGEIRAHQREVVMAIRLADAAHALECGLVADVPAERVTGIGPERSSPTRPIPVTRSAGTSALSPMCQPSA